VARPHYCRRGAATQQAEGEVQPTGTVGGTPEHPAKFFEIAGIPPEVADRDGPPVPVSPKT
jgi:hypothetical protein